MKEKLTSKQKKFALEFLISGNITDAAKKAGYSERSARQIGSLNLTKPNVVEYMSEILSKTKSEEVATTEEVLEFLTSVMRGDIAEQFGLDPAITDRTIGNKDVIPKSEAIRLLGSGAVEFADRADSRYQNAYGIGDFTMEYLTREGFFIAVTYKNVEEQKQATKVKETNK